VLSFLHQKLDIGGVWYVQYNIISGADSSRDGTDNSHLSIASIRIPKLIPYRHSDSDTMFPKLNECAHFHYESVELQQMEVCILLWT